MGSYLFKIYQKMTYDQLPKTHTREPTYTRARARTHVQMQDTSYAIIKHQ